MHRLWMDTKSDEAIAIPFVNFMARTYCASVQQEFKQLPRSITRFIMLVRR